MMMTVSRPRTAASLLLAASVALSSCDTVQQNQKAVAGGFLGAFVAGGSCLLAHGNAALCAVLAAAGGVAGGVIGHQFDERDRARRQQALALALDTPALWPAPDGNAPPPEQPSAPAPAPERAPGGDAVQPTDARSDEVPAQPPAVAGGGAWIDPDKTVAWVNPDTRNAGTITPLRSYVDPANGRTCRQMTETYQRQGAQALSQNEEACQNPDGTWSFQNG